MFSLICAWTNGWTNNWDAGDLSHDRAHYDVTVMPSLVSRVHVWGWSISPMTTCIQTAQNWLLMRKNEKFHDRSLKYWMTSSGRHNYRQVSNISRTKSQHLKYSRTVLRLSLPNPLKPDVFSREWRCSWSSADRRCSNYIWVIDNFIAYWGVSYITGYTVYKNHK